MHVISLGFYYLNHRFSFIEIVWKNHKFNGEIELYKSVQTLFRIGIVFQKLVEFD
jgi:hypothetical protein